MLVNIMSSKQEQMYIYKRNMAASYVDNKNVVNSKTVSTESNTGCFSESSCGTYTEQAEKFGENQEHLQLMKS